MLRSVRRAIDRAAGPAGPRRSAQTLLFAALTVANVGNFGFHALASHTLGPASYGAVGSVLAILVAVTVPLTAYQAVLTAQVRRLHDVGLGAASGPALRRLLVVGAAAAAAVAVAAPALAAYLHLDSAAPLVAAGAYLVPLTAGTLGWALTTGTGRFRWAAVAVVAMVVTRLLLGALLLRAGTGVTGAVAASVGSESVLAAVLLVAGRDRRRAGRPLDLGWRDGTYSAATSIGLWLLIGSDVLLARHLFAGVTAGMYVAAATLARIAMFLPQAVATVLVPDFADTDPAAATSALTRGVAVSAAVGCLGAAALVVGAAPVTAVLFGPAYVLPLRLVALLSGAAVLLAILNVVVQFHLARGSRRALAPWAGVAALLATAVALHPSPVPLAGLLLVSALLAVVLAVNGVTLAVLPVRPGLATGIRHELDLTVVIPYYNPGDLLRPNVLRLVEALRQAQVSFEVVTVSDGSTDGSADTIADLDPQLVHRIALPRNAGKGAAVCAGLQVGRGRYLGFIDADGDLDPTLWQPILTLLRLYRPDAVVGSKWHPLSDVRTSPARRVCSRGYQVLHRLLFRLPVRDTQVGLKVFRRELLVDALPLTREQRFAFDLELLAVARRLGYRRMMEAPVSLVAQGRSTVHGTTVVRMLVETLRLAWRVHTLTPAPVRDAVPSVPAQRAALDPADGGPWVDRVPLAGTAA